MLASARLPLSPARVSRRATVTAADQAIVTATMTYREKHKHLLQPLTYRDKTPRRVCEDDDDGTQDRSEGTRGRT